MVDVIDRQEELEIVFVDAHAVFRPAICHDPQYRQVVLIIAWQHPVIAQVGGGYQCFGGVELGMRHLAIGVDIGLLVDPSNTLERADIEGVLRGRMTA